MSAEPNGRKKTLYHSELRTLSEGGPVRVLLLDRPQNSKYPGKASYCRMMVEAGGEEVERTYEIENNAVYEFLLESAVGEWMSIVASGSREDAALKETATPREQRNRQVVQVEAQASATPTKAGPADTSLARSYFAALEAAVELVEVFRKRHGREPTECERAVACSLWVEQNRSNGRRPLKGGAR